tara:strand:+ start:522 stop:1238 length:717 start_codon:yes stop_codon:yes gene_type:complete
VRTAILSDIHGNLEAFEAMHAAIQQRGVERWVFLGNVVGYGADPQACLTLMRQLSECSIKGNHDAAVAGQEDLAYFNSFAREAVEWTNAQLPGEAPDYLAGLPLTLESEDDIYVHAEPSDPGAWSYVLDADDDAKALNATAARCCFVGHIHRAFVCCRGGDHANMLTTGGVVQMEENRRYLVNLGSVGQPRDGDPRACGGDDDDERDLFEFLRIEYDIATARRKIEAAGLPSFLGERL